MIINYQANTRAGSSILATIGVLAVLVVLVGAALHFTSTLARQASRQRAVLHAEEGAESAVEYIYAKWKADITSALPNGVNTATFALPTTLHPALAASPSSGTGLLPSFAPRPLTFPANVGYTTTDQWGATTPGQSQVLVSNVPGYPGWTGKSVFYRAEASVSSPAQNSPITQGVRRYLQLTFVPLFQAAIFYEDDLEIHPGPPMTITGLVHTNKNLEVLAYDKLRFMDNVSYAEQYKEEAIGNWSGSGDDEDYTNPTEKPYWEDDLQSGQSAAINTQLKAVDRIEPLGTRPKELFDIDDANKNNDGFREIIEEPVAVTVTNPDPKEIASMRFYNKASLKIKVDSSKAYGAAGYLKVYDRNNVLIDPSAPIAAKVQTAILNTTNMYDQRETTSVKVTSLDMNKFNDVITTMAPTSLPFNGVVYITDTSADASKDAIRLVNGRIINSDITIATDEGLYIQGDYNTGGASASSVPSNAATPGVNHTADYTVKATAIAADAVTILSNNWSDANAASQLTSRKATNTTVNTAIVSGNVPTNFNSSGNPSGGVHNFPRFLELWLDTSTYKPINFTYFGSMVELFQSKSFTGLWYTNNTYWPPNRLWNFDTNFRTRPPPGSLQATQLSRGRWERF